MPENRGWCLKKFGKTVSTHGTNCRRGGGVFQKFQNADSDHAVWYRWYDPPCPHFDQVSGKTMDGSNVIRQKVSFLAILGHFGAFSAIKEPLGTQRELFSEISEYYIFPL